MKYMLLIYSNEAAAQAASKAQTDQMIAAYGAYTEAVTKAGILAGSNRLQRTTAASTVRVANGKTQVLDGPYAETKEQLAGYYMIEVPDLDAALSWAARCPGASHGVVEVRPIWTSVGAGCRCRSPRGVRPGVQPLSTARRFATITTVTDRPVVTGPRHFTLGLSNDNLSPIGSNGRGPCDSWCCRLGWPRFL